MSSTLKWRPANAPSKSLPSDLKHPLSCRLWEGSTGSGEKEMDLQDIEYLEGLRDAGVKGAKELIEHIVLHGTIVLWHEH